MKRTEFSKDEIRQLIKEQYSVSQIAEILDADLSALENFYICCFNENRHEFPLHNLLTKEWLEEKLQKNTTVISISALTGASPTAIHRLMKKYGIEKPKINKVLTPEILYALYIEQGLSAASIAKQYRCSIDTVKKLASTYKLSADERNRTIPAIDTDFFFLLYVTYGFTLHQIAQMLGCATHYLRYTLLKDISNDEDYSQQDLRKQKKQVPYFYIINILYEKLEPTVLFEQLKSNSITAIAEMYDVIPKTGYELFTKEWLQYLLTQMTLSEISDKFHTSYGYLASLKKQFGLSSVLAEDKLDEALVRKLFVDNGWSNEEIASALDTSVYSVVQFRKMHKIKRKNNVLLKDRISQQDFEQLFINEGLTIKQIAELYNVSATRISELRMKYGESNPVLLSHKPQGVSEQRLRFLKKEIKFKGLK